MAIRSEISDISGIVLIRRKINPLDCYLSIFTRELGLIEVFAKNANDPKNQLNRGTSPFVFGTFGLAGRKEFRLCSVEVREAFYQLRNELSSFARAAYLSKLLLAVLEERQSAKRLFESFVNTVFIINKFPARYNQALLHFYGSLAYDMGIYPSVETNSAEYFDVAEGGVCASDENSTAKPAKEEIQIIRLQKSADFKQFLNTRIPDDILERTRLLWEEYLSYHLDIDLSELKDDLNTFHSDGN